MMFNGRTPLLYGIGVALAFAIATGEANAQTDRAAPKPGMGRGMPATPEPGMAGRQKMMAEMQAAQKKLDDLVSVMNSAQGAEKVDRIAALLTELVAQHRQMGMRMMSMDGGMMQMMRPASGASAPTQPREGAAADDHAQHHPKP